METLMVVEVLGPHGDVRFRHSTQGPALNVGRGYANQVVLDDAHVCPQHARLEQSQEDGWVLRDVGSLNGLRDERGRRLGDKILLNQKETLVTLGQTTLRIRQGQATLPATLPLDQDVSHRFSLAWVLPVGLMLLLGLTALELRWAGDPMAEWSSIAGPLAGVLFSLALWSAVWALISRVVRGQAHYFSHVWVVVYTLLLASGLSPLLDWLVYSLAWSEGQIMVMGLQIVLAGTVLLSGHLASASHLSWRRRVLLGLALSTVVAALPVTQHWATRTPGYGASLSLWRATLAPAHDLPDWLRASDALVDEVEHTPALAPAAGAKTKP